MSTVTTMSNHGVIFGQVPITAGAGKLMNLASCTQTSTPTSSSNAAAATAISEVYKLLIVPGAIALLGGV